MAQLSFQGISLGIIILDVHTPDAAVITETEAALRNNLQSSEFFITFGTTIITTSLIAYRIYSTARLDGITSLGRFKHIVEVLIQSAAFYSLVILATAIMMVIPTYLSRPNGMFNAELFVDSILPIVGVSSETILCSFSLTNLSGTCANYCGHSTRYANSRRYACGAYDQSYRSPFPNTAS